MVGVMQLALVVGAHATINTLQCRARTLRCESHYNHCLSRCDHRANASQQAADVVQAQQTKCETGCEDRYQDRLGHIEGNPPCQDSPGVADPYQCEARYLAIEANYMTCQARCEGRADSAMCQKICTTRRDTNLDRLRGNSICAKGKVDPPAAPGSF